MNGGKEVAGDFHIKAIDKKWNSFKRKNTGKK